MAAFQAKINLFFESENYGWSETYYHSTPTYVGATTVAAQLAAIRQQLLGGSSTVNYWRVSDDNVFRDAFVHTFNPPLPAPNANKTLGPEAPAFCAVLLRMTSDQLFRRALYLRGWPNAGFTVAPFTIQGLMVAPLASLVVLLTNGNFQVKGFDRALPQVTIGTIAAPGLFTTIVAHGLVVGDRVRVYGRSRGHNPVGVKVVATAPTPNTFTLQGVDLPADYLYVPGSLSVRKLTPVYRPITICQPERVTKRSTGRPFDAPRGRRSPARA